MCGTSALSQKETSTRFNYSTFSTVRHFRVRRRPCIAFGASLKSNKLSSMARDKRGGDLSADSADTALLHISKICAEKSNPQIRKLVLVAAVLVPVLNYITYTFIKFTMSS